MEAEMASRAGVARISRDPGYFSHAKRMRAILEAIEIGDPDRALEISEHEARNNRIRRDRNSCIRRVAPPHVVRQMNPHRFIGFEEVDHA